MKSPAKVCSYNNSVCVCVRVGVWVCVCVLARIYELL